MPAIAAVSTPASTSVGFRMPTKAELTKIYRSMADSAEKHHTAKHLAKAPVAHPEKYPSYVLSHGVDAARVAYAINGQLYVNTWAANPRLGTWEKIGPLPLF